MYFYPSTNLNRTSTAASIEARSCEPYLLERAVATSSGDLTKSADIRLLRSLKSDSGVSSVEPTIVNTDKANWAIGSSEVSRAAPAVDATESFQFDTHAFGREQRSKSELRLKFPFNFDRQGLFWCVYLHVEEIYSELDKLEASGLAVGLDLLPSDVLQFEMFSGNPDSIDT